MVSVWRVWPRLWLIMIFFVLEHNQISHSKSNTLLAKKKTKSFSILPQRFLYERFSGLRINMEARLHAYWKIISGSVRTTCTNEKKVLRAKNKPNTTKALRKAIMRRSALNAKDLKSMTHKNLKTFKNRKFSLIY